MSVQLIVLLKRYRLSVDSSAAYSVFTSGIIAGCVKGEALANKDSISSVGSLLAQLTCPNCCQRVAPDQLLFIARHESLVGDPVAGATAYRRFRPSRFNTGGDALDPRGTPCHQVACPHCHLEIARPLLELPAFFLSIVGAPASGKSYFLAAMTWEMRNHCPRLGLTFADGDPAANHELQRYEQTLFMNGEPDTPVALRKTEVQGEQLYQSIEFDGQPQTFPRPFLFTARPHHDDQGSTSKEARRPLAVVLYDNAGEHFLPGEDRVATPVTLHVARSAAICFLFDPTQDARFRSRCRADDPQLQHGARPGAETAGTRQETILNEMIARVRRYRGLRETERHNRPLIMILAKADIWLPEAMLVDEPLTADESPRLDTKRVEDASAQSRQILQTHCPEVVAAAEAFSPQVTYVPVSSLGCSPELVDRGEQSFYGIRPAHIQPRWVTVPMLCALHKTAPHLLPYATGGEQVEGGTP